MKADLKPGRYVLAVSGGVDSMVLLDLLSKKPDVRLIVAHFNHGIRSDSDKDERLVRQVARELNLPFEVGHGHLDRGASEETARTARYKFLSAVKVKYQADAIITAHHQDDYLETAFINLIRGTGRKGLVAISTNPQIRRPLLRYPKKDIKLYAKRRGLIWREDKTNHSNDYWRNYLRNGALKQLTVEDKQFMIKNIEKVANTNKIIDYQIAKISQLILTENAIDRFGFTTLPSQIGDELVVYWLRQRNMADFNRKTIQRVSNAIRTNRSHTKCLIRDKLSLSFTDKTAKFTSVG